MQFKARLVSPGPWGFRLTGGKEQNQPLTISRTTAGGKAAKADIKKDDLLTAINGEPTFDMTLAQAQEKIRQIKGDLFLSLMRIGTDVDRKDQPPQAASMRAPTSPYQPQQAQFSPPPPPPPPPPPAPQQHYTPKTYQPVRPAVRSPSYQESYSSPPTPFGQPPPRQVLPATAPPYRPITSPSPKDKKPFTYGYDPTSSRSPQFRPAGSTEIDNTPRVEIRKEPQYHPHHQPTKVPSYYRRIDPTHGAGDQMEEEITSPTAKVVHLQYNSPVGIYSAGNIADAYQEQTADMIGPGRTGVIGGGGGTYVDHGSSVYKQIHDNRPPPRHGEASARYIEKKPGEEMQYHGFSNPGCQSRSFRALQMYVQDEDQYGQEL